MHVFFSHHIRINNYIETNNKTENNGMNGQARQSTISALPVLKHVMSFATRRLIGRRPIYTPAVYRVVKKKRGHSTFSQISRKLLKISKWFFCTHQASVCRTWHIHTNVSNSFYSVAPSGEYWTIITNLIMQHQNSNLYILGNGGVALKTSYSVMVDTSSKFVELKSTTLVLWTWSRSRFCIFTRATDLGLYAY